MRNTSETDTVYLSRAAYFDTDGKLERTYFEKPIFLAPMETVEIIIDEKEEGGGTGSNFIFDWHIPNGVSEPLFEAIMNSTYSQQGISFTTQAMRIE